MSSEEENTKEISMQEEDSGPNPNWKPPAETPLGVKTEHAMIEEELRKAVESGEATIAEKLGPSIEELYPSIEAVKMALDVTGKPGSAPLNALELAIIDCVQFASQKGSPEEAKCDPLQIGKCNAVGQPFFVVVPGAFMHGRQRFSGETLPAAIEAALKAVRGVREGLLRKARWNS